MNAQQRRTILFETLQRASRPISATTLAQQLGVSRQIIVGDIALLRAAGTDICATPRGYVIVHSAPGLNHRVACRHASDQMAQELHTMIDCGCTILDVIVEHPIYGQLTGPLQLSSHADVELFLTRCASQSAQPLSLLTEGIHLHTLSCPDAAALANVQEKLSQAGFLLAD